MPNVVENHDVPYNTLYYLKDSVINDFMNKDLRDILSHGQ